MPGEERIEAPRRPPVSDRTALALVGLIGGVLAIFVMLHQLLVFQPEYQADLRAIRDHLARLDQRVGLERPSFSTARR